MSCIASVVLKPINWCKLIHLAYPPDIGNLRLTRTTVNDRTKLESPQFQLKFREKLKNVNFMKDRRIYRIKKYMIFRISKGHRALYGVRLLLLLYLLIYWYYTIITILILLHLIYYVNLYYIFKSVYNLRL